MTGHANVSRHEQVKRRGDDVCEPMAGLGIEHGNSAHNRPRSGMGLQKKQCEGFAPRALFFWTGGLPCWRNSDKGKTYSRSTWPTSPVLAWKVILHPNRPWRNVGMAETSDVIAHKQAGIAVRSRAPFLRHIVNPLETSSCRPPCSALPSHRTPLLRALIGALGFRSTPGGTAHTLKGVEPAVRYVMTPTLNWFRSLDGHFCSIPSIPLK
jgi:hypothetical protein